MARAFSLSSSFCLSFSARRSAVDVVFMVKKSKVIHSSLWPGSKSIAKSEGISRGHGRLQWTHRLDKGLHTRKHILERCQQAWLDCIWHDWKKLTKTKQRKKQEIIYYIILCENYWEQSNGTMHFYFIYFLKRGDDGRQAIYKRSISVSHHLPFERVWN